MFVPTKCMRTIATSAEKQTSMQQTTSQSKQPQRTPSKPLQVCPHMMHVDNCEVCSPN
eukprot:m.163510 g.163510  ORF g.163510 m.163510 type:complete len:58 (+) comp31293_c2_seq4:1231-1404(+)